MKRMENLKSNKKGFTLIELIVIMAVLAVLVALGAPRFLGYTKDANATGIKADAKIIEQAAMQYALENDDALAGDGVAVDLTVFDAEIKDILVSQGVAVDVAGLVDVTAETVDGSKVSEYIRSTANDVSEFAIVTSGSEEGMVFHTVGQENRAGDLVIR